MGCEVMCGLHHFILYAILGLNSFSTQNHGDGKREGKEKWPRKVFNFL